jgi:hypothetical protein
LSRREVQKMTLADSRVMVRTGSTLRTDVTANDYTLVADEPVSVGVLTLGPHPTTTCWSRSGRAPR